MLNNKGGEERMSRREERQARRLSKKRVKNAKNFTPLPAIKLEYGGDNLRQSLLMNISKKK